ncbi:tRNA epoxyqueuosine(34) reductase QueG [Utexia brackfieldae]|uniref:tRNA epoxyqueuosine(34) reductase QueG n=1 Tax=Utexia brackfieldae TaxID=3074108 RepID=UPI00370D8FB2
MIDYVTLAEKIKVWGEALGFVHVGICNIDLSLDETALQQWLKQGYHGEMQWMAAHGELRSRPDLLLPGTLRVISVSLPYLPYRSHISDSLANPDNAYVSRYALGRDYHKLMRQRLQKLGEQIKHYCETLSYRPFVDSAPLLERSLAAKAGLGWRGKHSLLLKETGSFFFLGELLVNMPLPVDQPVADLCGKCQACLQICPTQAIVEPYVVDARRCISYLTIEYDGIIPEALRPLIGNRIYGCDDCQLICPFNRQPDYTQEADFAPRHGLDKAELLALYEWDEATFLKRTEGSPIRRVGYAKWLRNITVALGNAAYDERIVQALKAHQQISPLLDNHIDWALARQEQHRTQAPEVTTRQARLLRQIALREL